MFQHFFRFQGHRANAGREVQAGLTIIAIPLTFSIAEGIGIGLISAALLALALGKPRSITRVGYSVAAVFFLQFLRNFPFNG